jgi:phosphatidate cytidylyltransferase
MSYLEPTERDLRAARHRAAAAEAPAPGVETPPPQSSSAPPPANGRAGRNLPAAIAVGASLGAVVLASLLFWRPAFVFLVAAAVTVAIWEMVRAVGHDGGPRPPLVPLLGGALVMVTLAWFVGPEALILGLVFTVLAAMVWRLADGPGGYQRDLLATVLIAVYVPFLGGFAVLLDRPDNGVVRVIVAFAAVVLSDTGGYVFGVFFGRHAMAPSVSPKKSWEGTAGSLLIAAIGGALMLYFVFHVPWWHGALFGLGVAAASVLGDLAESLVKRDLKIKDMSNLLPGHGGLMDRVDSILFAAPTAFILFSVLVPAGQGG